MQVDSHVRFTQNWDADLIKEWKAAKNEYAVLTTYLSDIHDRIDPITHRGTDPSRPIMVGWYKVLLQLANQVQ
jgi:hypothetical protein